MSQIDCQFVLRIWIIRGIVDLVLLSLFLFNGLQRAKGGESENRFFPFRDCLEKDRIFLRSLMKKNAIERTCNVLEEDKTFSALSLDLNLRE